MKQRSKKERMNKMTGKKKDRKAKKHKETNKK